MTATTLENWGGVNRDITTKPLRGIVQAERNGPLPSPDSEQIGQRI